MKLKLTCKDTASLLIASQDRTLPWAELLAVKMHLAICKTCPVFERQLLTMQNAMRQWRNYQAPEV